MNVQSVLTHDDATEAVLEALRYGPPSPPLTARRLVRLVALRLERPEVEIEHVVSRALGKLVHTGRATASMNAGGVVVYRATCATEAVERRIDSLVFALHGAPIAIEDGVQSSDPILTITAPLSAFERLADQ